MVRSSGVIAGLVLMLGAIPWSARGEDRVFFGGLHSHTSYSDGSGLPEEAYAHARDLGGCDFFALTEHNHNNNLHPREPREGMPPIGGDHALYNGPRIAGRPLSLIEAARAATVDGTFVAIYGQEFSSIGSGNHVNVFDVPEVIDVPSGKFGQLLTWIRSSSKFDTSGQPAIIQFNHPRAASVRMAKDYGSDDFGTREKWIAEMGQHACTIEILNGPGTEEGATHALPPADEEAYRFYLTQGFRLAPCADQDNHFRTWGTFTTARTGVIAANLTKAEILGAIRARHVYATSDRNLRVIAKVNTHLAGDVITDGVEGSELAIGVSITDDDETDADYRIEVFAGKVGDAHSIQRLDVVPASGNGEVTIEDIHLGGEGQFIYFKVTQSNEDGPDDRAWTAPVWFERSVDAVTLDAESRVVASKKSAVYHTNPECPSARAIKASNRVTGAKAKEGREAHDCPEGR